MERKEPGKKMTKKIMHNWVLKLASLALAMVLWFVVVQIEDPPDTKTFSNVTVKLVNTDLLRQENKVYEIGDKFRPSKAKKIKLTGQVIDFKTNTPAVGIHVIRRDPWTAATTDVDGRFEIELAPGYNVLELQGISVKAKSLKRR